ncbi:MAG: DNA mismatch repair endonuclease MutL [Ruminococcaceae bacterium]|nr:DNA mismatch repair endonuclease MutL [Oscillospiraceae bacterium]
MAKIQVLDKHVAELIAAGEVVERPASVVKELMENTIDAGAKHVTVEIRDGGISYMRITDDGCGIHREDVATAFLRHATSKVRTEEDLGAIGTLGFRGEALASVAAVAKVEVTTCATGEMVGTRYVIHGGEEILIEDAGCAEGSTFVVEDLFYNIPARMKFLKKDVSEGNAVAGVVERLALSHPEIAVKFIRNGRVELQTPGDGQVLSCIHAVFGKQFASTLMPVEYSMGGVTVSGFVCKPEYARPNRTMQHYFVNDRYVKTQTGLVALERAYKGMLMAGRFPACVLFISLPAETVDANVHPAKIEVRFINEKPVFDAVYYGVRSALESRSSIRQMELPKEPEKPVAPAYVPKATPVVTPILVKPESPAVVPTPAKRPSFLDMVVDDQPAETGTLADTTGKEEPKTTGLPLTLDDLPTYEPSKPKTVTPPESRPEPEQLVMEQGPEIQVLGELFKTYILAQMGESLFIIDKHAAHERILFNKLKSQARVDEQLLLTPVAVTVSREEHSALLESVEELQSAGITLEDFGGQCVLVRTFPMILSGADIDSTIREIAAGFVGGNREVQSSKLDWIYHSSACRAAVKAGDNARPAELLDLAKQVLTDENIRFCPHGRPVCVEMTRKELEKQFGRIV